MIIITMDVHKDYCQLAAHSDVTGEVFLETKVMTDMNELRKVVGSIKGKKRLVMEAGPMSAMIHDAMKGEVDEIISCDPARNALISRSEDSNDERDARRLIILARADAIRPVYIPPEPYLTFRSLVRHDRGLRREVNAVKNRIHALCRRNGIRRRGAKAYTLSERSSVLDALPNAEHRWQMEGLYRHLDFLRKERIGVHRILNQCGRKIKSVESLESMPGIKENLSKVIAAWIVDPARFKSRSALSVYAGLGIGKNITAWTQKGRAYASKRGNRELKRAFFLAAQSAINGDNAFARRYNARIAAGWDPAKAKRDVARKMLFTACALWKKGEKYDDKRVSVPDNKRGGR